ncbi:TPA: hypothetical protein ACXNIA_002735, partial [Pseudomonas aeruginosa]
EGERIPSPTRNRLEWPLRFLVMRGCRARLQRIATHTGNPMPYRVLLLILALTPALASSATLDERLGDLEHAFKPDLDGPESAKPASPPPKRFKLAPLGSVVRKKECATSSLPDEQSSCAALEFCTDCAQ